MGICIAAAASTRPPNMAPSSIGVRTTVLRILVMLVVCRGFGDPVECGSSSLDFGDDFFGGFVPDERFRVLVPVFGPHLDGVDELVDAGEAVTAEAFVGEFFEPAFDEVQPR